MAGDRHWIPQRAELAKIYPGKKWERKVLEMSDAQVIATLASIRKQKEKKEERRVAV